MNKHLSFFSQSLTLAVLLLLSLSAISQEEFNGAFPSWANVKTRFKGAGDGITDDTKALQRALDSLTVRAKNYNTGKQAYTVIFLPKGRYKISKTLVLRGKIGVSLIGEDPVNTFIEWSGPAKDTMFWANGSAYFKVSRITWNAKERDSMTAVGIHWKEVWNNAESQSFAPLNIEISDCHFIGKCFSGISGGTSNTAGTGNNDSEVAIKRCVFESCRQAITIYSYNALDYWIWDCTFNNCFRCVNNTFGNYHMYRCYFQNTINTVFYNMNGYYTSVRGCYSNKTYCFSYDDGKSCNPFKRIFEDNYVSKTDVPPVYYYHLGKLYFNNNVFAGTADATNPYSLIYDSWCKGKYEVLSIANQYPFAKPWRLNVANKTIYSINDGFNPASVKKMPDAFQRTMAVTPAFKSRKVFEVPAYANSNTIQEIILSAAKLTGQRTIVHFAAGDYLLDKPLVIPANSDIQLIGDGFIYASNIKLARPFPAGKAAFIVKGPSSVSIRDLYFEQDIGPRSQFNAISFENTDQKKAVAFVDQLYSLADHAIVLNKTDFLYVQHENSFFSDGSIVHGGELVKKGQGSSALHCFGAQFAGIQVTNNGRFVAKDCWWEGASKLPINLTGEGNVTIDGAMVAASRDSSTGIKINNFSGKVTLMNMYVQGGLEVKPDNPALDLLVWNINFYYKMAPYSFISRNASFRAALMGITTQCFDNRPFCGDPVCHEKYLWNVKKEQEFILSGVDDERRAAPVKYAQTNPGISNVYISRISVGNFNQAITFNK